MMMMEVKDSIGSEWDGSGDECDELIEYDVGW